MPTPSGSPAQPSARRRQARSNFVKIHTRVYTDGRWSDPSLPKNLKPILKALCRLFSNLHAFPRFRQRAADFGVIRQVFCERGVNDQNKNRVAFLSRPTLLVIGGDSTQLALTSIVEGWERELVDSSTRQIKTTRADSPPGPNKKSFIKIFRPPTDEQSLCHETFAFMRRWEIKIPPFKLRCCAKEAEIISMIAQHLQS